MTIKLSGFRELSDTLSELSKPTQRAVLRRVATKALEPFVARAKQLVPVHEGHLRDSIVISQSLSRRAKAFDKALPKAGVRVFAGSSSRNAVPREFGSQRSPAQPFIRPAWEQTKDGMLDTIRKELGPDIERTVVRVAKKAAKSR